MMNSVRQQAFQRVSTLTTFLSTPLSILLYLFHRIFDTNDDNVINFREFIIAFATFLNETIDKQIKLSFKIYDPEDKGYVEKSTLLEIMKDAIKGLGTLELPDEIIEEIVEETFRDLKKYQVDKNGVDFTGQVIKNDKGGDSKRKPLPEEVLKGGVVTFEMYEKMVYENNDIIKWLAIDLHRICQGAKLITSDKAVIKNITK